MVKTVSAAQERAIIAAVQFHYPNDALQQEREYRFRTLETHEEWLDALKRYDVYLKTLQSE